MLRRATAVMAALLAAGIFVAADDSAKKEAAQPAYTLDVTKMKIPDAKVAGTIHGADFALDKAELENGILTLRQGKDFFPDLSLQIFLFLKDGETVDGKNFKITPKAGFSSPHIHLSWKAKDQGVPESETFSDKYAMVLQFGKGKDGMIPGKIYVCLPDKAKSCVAGTFVIGDPGVEPAGGIISGKITLRGASDKNFWLDVGCLGKDPKGDLERPGIGFQLDGSATSGTCTTWAPRNTSLAWTDKGSGSHRHVGRAPGQYLVYLRGRPTSKDEGIPDVKGFLDWKWVEIKDENARVTVDFVIDLAKMGTLEVTVPGATKDADVRYVPLDASGKLPLPEAASYGVAWNKLQSGKVVIDMMREGKYIVSSGDAQSEVEIKAGKTIKLDLKAKK